MERSELADYLAGNLGDHVVEVTDAFGTLTVTLDADGYVEAARMCRNDERLACDLFDSSFGVDEREDGFAVVTVLYSTEHRHRVLLRHLCEGGREQPVAPSLTSLYRGADWMERETWDMFGIEFQGHPGLAPRILCSENFEGWPLRKDFYLASREAKPWPGVKEPLEVDEEGRPLDRIREHGPGDAHGPTALDEIMADQARRVAGSEPGEDAGGAGEPDADEREADR